MTTLFLVIIPIIICFLIFFISSSILYKIVFLALGGFLMATLGLNYLNILLKDNINKSKVLMQQNKTKQDDSNKHPTKKVENEDYDVLITVLKQNMKDKKLNRNNILDFKSKLNECLGEHFSHYGKFNFKNDMHEIYIKLKNNCLTSKDYKDLLLLLNSYSQRDK